MDQLFNFPPNTFVRVAQSGMQVIIVKFAPKDIMEIPSKEFSVDHVHVAIIHAIQSLDNVSNVTEILKVGSVISVKKVFIQLIPSQMDVNHVRVRSEPPIMSAIRQLQHAHANQITLGTYAMIALLTMQMFR